MQPPPPPTPDRAVVIHGHAHALAALRAGFQAPDRQGPGHQGPGRQGPGRHGTGRPSCRLVLLSAPGAAGFLGPAWWAALMESLRPEMATAIDLLDCGSSAGRAMEALRIGLRRLVLSPDCAQHAAVLARAAPLGAEVRAVRPEALDMAERTAARRLPEWLHGAPAR